MKKIKHLLFSLVLVFMCQLVHAQITIQGTVTDEDGNAVSTATVREKGTSNGTLTDADGNYSIEVEGEQSTLTFSFLGYTPQDVLVGSQRTINTTLLMDNQLLDEAVVVGYGVQKRANLTGSVSTVDTKVLESRPVTDVGRALQGATPGLQITMPSGQIGENPTIKLRGNTGTLGTDGGAQPLILVDNVEVTSLQDVNPEDIASISVLKDAASTSIYGTRAAWGVILITTKSGSYNTKPKISYSNNFSWNTPTVTPDIAPAAEGAQLSLDALRRILPGYPGTGILGMRIDDSLIEGIRNWEATYGGQNLGPEMVEGRDFEFRDGYLYFYRPWDAKEMFVEKWSPQTKHDLTVSGGSENMKYYLGLGMLDQEGVYKVNKDSFKRYNINLGVDSKINDWLDVRGKFLHTNNVNETPFKFGSNTYDAWYYTTRWHRFYPYGTYEGKQFRSHISELQQANLNDDRRNLNRINLGTTVSPATDLKINFDYTFDSVDEHEKQVGGVLSAYNFWSGRREAVLNYVPYSSASYNRVSYFSDWSKRNTAKVFGTYDKTLNDRHTFKFTAGGDWEQYEYWGQYSTRNDLLNLDQGELDLATGPESATGDRNKWRTMGLFGRINYDLDGKYLLELNGRRDGSSRLSNAEKWGFFPSGSIGWIVSEENFMKNAGPISFLKLRASYGSVGNENAVLSNIYRIMGVYGSDWLINGEEVPTVETPGFVPEGLTWETVTTLDYGVDVNFFENRLALSFDKYTRTVTDMHSPGVTLPSPFGTSAPKRNYGAMETDGWDFELTFRHAFDNGLNLTAGANIGDFKERITKYENSVNNIYGLYEGKELGEIWGYKTDRFFTEDDFNADGTPKAGIASQELFETASWFKYGPGDIKYQDLNGDGVIDFGSNTLEDHGDLVRIGNTAPRYQYGFNLGAGWKGLDFSMFMQGVGRKNLWPNGPMFVPGYRRSEVWYSHMLDHWTPENTGAYYPRVTGQTNNEFNFKPQSKYLLNLSYLRMKNMALGYTLPNSILSSIKANKLRVYVSGDNLFEFTNVQIPIDPEVDYTVAGRNDSNTFGRSYPFRRLVSGGVQLTF